RSARAVLRRGSAVPSAFFTHERSVSVVQPIFSAIDRIASHRVGYSWTCSWNSRTARSRTSVGYLFDVFPMAPFSQVMEPPGNPGRFSPRIKPSPERLEARQVGSRYSVGPR